jgi:hypothetical protein
VMVVAMLVAVMTVISERDADQAHNNEHTF